MKTFAACAVYLFATLTLIGVTSAQESLMGKYSGNVIFPGKRGDTPLGLELNIQSVQDGMVKATANYFTRGSCAGEYPMEGKVDGEKVSLRSIAKQGRAGDCGLSLNLTSQGAKLVGTTGGGHAVQLSK